MNKTLIILNSFYPYARHEDFLANECDYISGFDEVVFAPNSINEPVPSFIYNVNSDFKYIVNASSFKSRRLLLLLRVLMLKVFYKDFFLLLRNKKFSLATLNNLVSFLCYSLNSYDTVSKYIKDNCTDKEIYLYSYWMHCSAFVACMLKQNFSNVHKAITRCHGFDLYEYRSPHNYIPMRQFIFDNIDEIHSISKDGIKYISNTYKSIKAKLVLSRLGTKANDCMPHSKNKVLKLVSCSWIKPVKRVNLILDAISQVSNIEIEWTHFGSGEGYDELLRKSQEVDRPNVKINLVGAKSNEEVIKSYQTQKYDVFVNVSSSEGIPVSIMEAMSLGMIIVATAVGGTPEVVDDSNGFLLDKDFETNELVAIIEKINNLSDIEFKQMSVSSRQKWEKSFSAEKNYTQFYSNMLKINEK